MNKLKTLNIGEEIVLLGLMNLLISDSLAEWENEKGFNQSKKSGQALQLLTDMADELETIVYGVTQDATEFESLASDVEGFILKHKLNYASRLSLYLHTFENVLTFASIEFRKAYSRQTMPLIKLCLRASENNSFSFHFKGKTLYKSFLSLCCEEIKKLNVQFADY